MHTEGRATKISAQLQQLSHELRFEPSIKHLRELLSGHVVMDSRRADVAYMETSAGGAVLRGPGRRRRVS